MFTRNAKKLARSGFWKALSRGVDAVSRSRCVVTASRCAGVLVSVVLGMNVIATGALAQGAGDAVKKTLQVQDESIQNCISALDAIGSNAKADDLLRGILAQVHAKTFEPKKTLEQVNALAGQSLNLTAEDLETCVSSYRARTAPKTAEAAALLGTPGIYPDCTANQTPCKPTAGPGTCCDTATTVCSSSCGARGQGCFGYCESKSCFPANATIRLENGSVATMDQLKVGDRVQVVYADGSIGYDDIYLMTHNDPAWSATYVKVELASGQSLTLSPRHFVPVSEAGSAWGEHVLKGANELAVGSVVWHRDAQGVIQSSKVTHVDWVVANGAFNPMTASGTVVVDGIVASAHSDWFLDGVVSAEIQGHVYQAILAPVRLAYDLIGPEWTQKITEEWGIVEFARDVVSTPGRAAVALLLMLLPIVGLIAVVTMSRRRRRALHGRQGVVAS